jgi:uncharacterized membrane protein YkvI
MTLARTFQTTLLLTASLFVAGCEAIADIFRAGFWVGAIIVLVIIGVIAMFLRRGRG